MAINPIHKKNQELQMGVLPMNNPRKKKPSWDFPEEKEKFEGKSNQSKRNLLVILQTYAEGNALPEHQKSQRMVGNYHVSKDEVSSRCTLSLVNALNYALHKDRGLAIQLKIFDDGSDPAFHEKLNLILSFANFQVNVEKLDGVGIMASMGVCYEFAKKNYDVNSGIVDRIYFTQDDFLHKEDSIHYMLMNYDHFSQCLGNYELTLSGEHNKRFFIQQNVQIPCRIVEGLDQYWRTTPYSSQFCMLIGKDLFLKNYDLFEAFGKHEYNENAEDDTINKMYSERGVWDFCPITSSVINIQWEFAMPSYQSVDRLWSKFSFNTQKQEGDSNQVSSLRDMVASANRKADMEVKS